MSEVDEMELLCGGAFSPLRMDPIYFYTSIFTSEANKMKVLDGWTLRSPSQVDYGFNPLNEKVSNLPIWVKIEISSNGSWRSIFRLYETN